MLTKKEFDIIGIRKIYQTIKIQGVKENIPSILA